MKKKGRMGAKTHCSIGKHIEGRKKNEDKGVERE